MIEEPYLIGNKNLGKSHSRGIHVNPLRHVRNDNRTSHAKLEVRRRTLAMNSAAENPNIIWKAFETAM